MLPLIPIALQLAQFAPSLVKIFTGSDKAADVAAHVVSIAQTVTGTDSGEKALAAIQADPAKAMEFQLAVQAQEQSMVQLYLTDTQDARKRDIAFVQSGVINYRANALAGAACAVVLLCLGIVVWASNIDEYAKGTITLVCGRALGWVEQLFSFEFGTTRANKTKDDTINNLTK